MARNARELIIDSFAGGGGASHGIHVALGRAPDVAINHRAKALAMHAANHPDTRHLTEDVFKVNPRRATGGKPVGLMWLSPDCKHFSRAKGGKPVSKKIRGLAWVAIKWAAEVRPRVIVLENVREFQDWGPLCPRWDCTACEWRGTEGQVKLKRRGKRACPRCDSAAVRETEHKVPDPARKGVTFRQFCGRLKALGYKVETAVLNAADYGAPTHRRRLFLIARRDGKPIAWPEPTHGDPAKIGRDLFSGELKPWRTAAECIDWSIPCPSIFSRKKPLAEKTLKRIALGIKRYVLDNPRPFLVDMQRENRPRGTDEPLGTVTTQDNRFSVVSPVVAPLTHNGERRSHPVGEPLPTVTGANRGELAVIAPIVANLAHGDAKDGRDRGLRVNEPNRPLGTVHAGGGSYAVIAPTLVQTGYGEREGQAPRTLDLHEPLGTVVGGGQKHALVSAFLARHFGGSVGAPADAPAPTVTGGGQGKSAVVAALVTKHYGGVVGVPADTPLPTTTARGTQNQLTVANLVHMNHGEKQWSGADEPMRTVTTGGHAALVYSFMVRYFPELANGCSVYGEDADSGRRDQSSPGRNDLEAGEQNQHGTTQADSSEAYRAEGKERLPNRKPASRRKNQTHLRPQAGVGDFKGTDSAPHGHQPQGRQQNEQPSGQPGASNSIGEPSARISPETQASNALPWLEFERDRRLAEGARDDLSNDRNQDGNQSSVSPPPVQTSFLIKSYSSGGQWQNATDPLGTVTTKDRFGLVTVEINGEPYAIVDIGMRMLRPRELARAQGFPEAYVLTGTNTDQVERIGNSVCPDVAAAIVRANCGDMIAKGVAA